jgi:iron(III) transport system ATP-binding protein
VELVQIDCPGIERPLQARVHDPVQAALGQDVGIEIGPKDVLVFAASDP